MTCGFESEAGVGAGYYYGLGGEVVGWGGESDE